jgi:hypothetical protein
MQNLKLLQSEIHTSFNSGLFGSGIFEDRIISLASGNPVSHEQYGHMYTHIVQELNRKYHFFGFDEKINTPVDCGFRPLEPRSLFHKHILLENGYELLTEDSRNLNLEYYN